MDLDLENVPTVLDLLKEAYGRQDDKLSRLLPLRVPEFFLRTGSFETMDALIDLSDLLDELTEGLEMLKPDTLSPVEPNNGLVRTASKQRRIKSFEDKIKTKKAKDRTLFAKKQFNIREKRSSYERLGKQLTLVCARYSETRNPEELMKAKQFIQDEGELLKWILYPVEPSTALVRKARKQRPNKSFEEKIRDKKAKIRTPFAKYQFNKREKRSSDERLGKQLTLIFAPFFETRNTEELMKTSLKIVKDETELLRWILYPESEVRTPLRKIKENK